MTNSLWVEKYRPTTLDTYLGNEDTKKVFKRFLKDEDFNHILLSGRAGIGKTTIAKILVKNIDCEYLYINASDENNVEMIRTKVKQFSSQRSFKKLKVVILDESDFLSNSAQAALRNIMETFSASTRFILTCNYKEKIIEALQSRCLVMDLVYPTKKEVAEHCINILSKEGVDYDLEILKELINTHYPDIRSIVKTLQLSSVDGKMESVRSSSKNYDYMKDVVEVLKSSSNPKDMFTEIRQIVADSGLRDFTDFYTYLYEKLDEYATGNKAQVILIIADYQFKDSSVVNKEINLISMFVEIINCITE